MPSSRLCERAHIAHSRKTRLCSLVYGIFCPRGAMMNGSFSLKILGGGRSGAKRTKVFLLGPEKRYTLKSNLAIETLSQSVSQAIKGGSARSWLLANASASAVDTPVYAPLTRKYLARSPKVTEKVVMLRRTAAGHVRVRSTYVHMPTTPTTPPTPSN